MKKYIYIMLSIVLLAVGAFFIANKESNSGQVNQQMDSMVKQVSDINGQIIDVRSPDEYQSSHADNAINIPLDEILNGDFSKIEKDRPIYVYCRSGNRSSQAKVALEQAGYKNIIDIGAISNWQQNGGAVCSSAKPSC